MLHYVTKGYFYSLGRQSVINYSGRLHVEGSYNLHKILVKYLAVTLTIMCLILLRVMGYCIIHGVSILLILYRCGNVGNNCECFSE
jgi:hypothetical protein